MKIIVNKLKKMKLKHNLFIFLISYISCITIIRDEEKTIEQSPSSGEVYIDLKTFSSNNIIYFMIKAKNAELTKKICVSYTNTDTELPSSCVDKTPSFITETDNDQEHEITYYFYLNYKNENFLSIIYYGYNPFSNGKLVVQCSDKKIIADNIIIGKEDEKTIESKSSNGLIYINLKTFSSTDTIYLMIKSENGELDEYVDFKYSNDEDETYLNFERKKPFQSRSKNSEVIYYYSFDYKNNKYLILKYSGYSPKNDDSKLTIKCSDQDLSSDTTELVLIVIFSILISILIIAGIIILFIYIRRRNTGGFIKRINDMDQLLVRDSTLSTVGENEQNYSKNYQPTNNAINPA